MEGVEEKMRESYFEKIFEGKIKFNNNELTKLNKKIKQEIFNENQFNEAKYFLNEDKIRPNEELYETHIIKPIVSFLNSHEGFGNLYLGIHTGGSGKSKFLNIKPISNKIIKGEDDLRDLIFNKLGTLPIAHEKPKIEIKKVEFKSGNVFVVFVEMPNNYSVYYSRITDYIYKRNSDESKKLSLIESLQLIESKKNPRVSLKLTHKKLTRKDKFREITYGVELINKGLEPSFFTTGIIRIKFKGNNQTTIKSKPNSWELIESDASSSKYQFCHGMPPNFIPIYPIINSNLGDLVIRTKDFFELDFVVKILDKKGMTSQKFSLIDKFEEKIMNFSPRNNEVIYSPYF